MFQHDGACRCARGDGRPRYRGRITVPRLSRSLPVVVPFFQYVVPQPAPHADAPTVSRIAHNIPQAVGEDLDRLHFNTAVARLFELTNVLSPQVAAVVGGEADRAGAVRQAIEFLIIMIAPMMPHLAEESWQALGGEGLVAAARWPAFEPALVVDNEVVLPVQVNGKKRGDLTIARYADQATVEKAALSLDCVQKALEVTAPRKFFTVPNRFEPGGWNSKRYQHMA